MFSFLYSKELRRTYENGVIFVSEVPVHQLPQDEHNEVPCHAAFAFLAAVKYWQKLIHVGAMFYSSDIALTVAMMA